MYVRWHPGVPPRAISGHIMHLKISMHGIPASKKPVGIPSRLSLRFASSNHLLIPPVRRSTVGARAFTVSGPALWNSLPSAHTSIDSLPVFRRHLKNYLLCHLYPITILFYRGPEAFYIALGHVNLIRNYYYNYYYVVLWSSNVMELNANSKLKMKQSKGWRRC